MCRVSPMMSRCVALLLPLLAASAADNDRNWMDLSKDFDAWAKPAPEWQMVGSVELDAQNPKRLASKPGNGIMLNGPKGTARDLVSKEKFADIEAHVEFAVPKGSNSGVKLESLYEIQIYDSFGKKDVTASDCGGIYPRAELQPRYHHIDKGIPPKTNACLAPGEWQTLDIIFLAPRFDGDGKKTANAKFVKVVLNGKVIHENVDMEYPTGHAWRNKEVASGPLLLQGDHGAVAFRNVRVRPYQAEKK